MVVYGLVNQVPSIQETLEKRRRPSRTHSTRRAPPVDGRPGESGLSSLRQELASGAAGAIGSLSTASAFCFGIFIGINIGVWVLIKGRQIGAWASHHVGPVPQPVAYGIIADSARFFRGYMWGSTIVGLFNAAVLGIGALVIGVPMAATIAIVAWITNYIPYFGAIISGAFAVLIA